MYIASPDGKFVYGWAIATDTGTAMMEGIVGVDLFYETYKESSLNWKNEVNIYIYD
jgi:3D (Asp-Asp-Asp) domain-containing protein